eukprot:118429-Prymnesium_polylepis.1
MRLPEQVKCGRRGRSGGARSANGERTAAHAQRLRLRLRQQRWHGLWAEGAGRQQGWPSRGQNATAKCSARRGAAARSIG